MAILYIFRKFVFGARGGNRTHTTLRSQNFKSCAYTSSATRAIASAWRPGAELNRRIFLLQRNALPLGYQAIYYFINLNLCAEK